jgi:hypothetical protein
VGLHVRDSRRDRELFLDDQGILAVPDDPNLQWQRVWIGTNPTGLFMFYDFARDRIWALNSAQPWYMDLSANPLTWIQQPFTGSFPANASTGLVSSAFAFDPVRDRVVTFGGAATCRFCNEDFADVYTLTLGGTPNWSLETVPGSWLVGTAPHPRLGSAMMYDPWRDRMLVYGGVSY